MMRNPLTISFNRDTEGASGAMNNYLSSLRETNPEVLLLDSTFFNSALRKMSISVNFNDCEQTYIEHWFYLGSNISSYHCTLTPYLLCPYGQPMLQSCIAMSTIYLKVVNNQHKNIWLHDFYFYVIFKFLFSNNLFSLWTPVDNIKSKICTFW